MATVTDPEKFKAEFTDVEEAYKEVKASFDGMMSNFN